MFVGSFLLPVTSQQGGDVPSQEDRSHPGLEGQQTGTKTLVQPDKVPGAQSEHFRFMSLPGWLVTLQGIPCHSLPILGEDTFMVLGHVTEGIKSSACRIL